MSSTIQTGQLNAVQIASPTHTLSIAWNEINYCEHRYVRDPEDGVRPAVATVEIAVWETTTDEERYVNLGMNSLEPGFGWFPVEKLGEMITLFQQGKFDKIRDLAN